jgi:hypothetical protein
MSKLGDQVAAQPRALRIRIAAQGLGEGVVAASSFRTSYVPLNTQADFIAGMQARSLLTSACNHRQPTPVASTYDHSYCTT